MNAKKWDYFIAHAGADQSSAEDLYAFLTPKSRVFLDTETLKLGDDWDQVLRDALKDSHIVVVLVSENSDLAFYQREEIATAISLSRSEPSSLRVVPVYLDGFPAASDPAPYGLRIKHGVAVSTSFTLKEVSQRLLQLRADLLTEGEFGIQRSETLEHDYAIDICFCVDTGGEIIGSPLEKLVLREVQTFPALLAANLQLKNKPTGKMRTRTIFFGTHVREHFIGFNKETDFDEPPLSRDVLHQLVRDSDVARGKCVVNYLSESLTQAMKSPWTTAASGKRRHIVVVWSDTIPDAHDTVIEQVENSWREMDATAKRLIIFAPECEFWESISSTFDNAIWYPSSAGSGLSNSDLEVILDAISNSV